MKYGIVVVVCVLVGCTSPLDGPSPRDEEEQIKIGMCFNTGGIPIRSTWDGRLENCIYPPKQP